MKTAEEIIEKVSGLVATRFQVYNYHQVSEAMKEYARQYVNECAKICKETLTKKEWIDTGLSEDFEQLINELK